MNLYISALEAIQQELTDPIKQAKNAKALEITENLIVRADAVERAASGSWRGGHANVYYNELTPVPGGESYLSFKKIKPPFPALEITSALYKPQYESRASTSTSSNWKYFSSELIEEHILGDVDKAEFEMLSGIAKECEELVDKTKDRVMSQLRLAGRHYSDPLLIEMADATDWLRIKSRKETIEDVKLRHDNPKIKSNQVATNQVRTPPHIEVYANAKWISESVQTVKRLANTVGTAIEHLAGLESLAVQNKRGFKPSGDKVFIGYGQSNAWQRLKSFLEDELELTPVFFNRGSAAGKMTLYRLIEMVEDASIAILVMTGDDELKDGTLHPRLNVVHEAGLFHSRLDNERVIILLEQGCQRFSNIEGITYISFPKDKISAAFPEIEETLHREGLYVSES